MLKTVLTYYKRSSIKNGSDRILALLFFMNAFQKRRIGHHKGMSREHAIDGIASFFGFGVSDGSWILENFGGGIHWSLLRGNDRRNANTCRFRGVI